jgi:hypothetical protein
MDGMDHPDRRYAPAHCHMAIGFSLWLAVVARREGIEVRKQCQRHRKTQRRGMQHSLLELTGATGRRGVRQVQGFTVVDNSDYYPSGLTVHSTRLMIRKLTPFLISSSEARYDLSHRRVPARVLPSPFSGTALASWLASSPGFPFTSKSCAHHSAPSAQATHATGLPFLPPGLHSLLGWRADAYSCTTLV